MCRHELCRPPASVAAAIAFVSSCVVAPVPSDLPPHSADRSSPKARTQFIFTQCLLAAVHIFELSFVASTLREWRRELPGGPQQVASPSTISCRPAAHARLRAQHVRCELITNDPLKLVATLCIARNACVRMRAFKLILCSGLFPTCRVATARHESNAMEHAWVLHAT